MTWIQKLEDLPALGQPVADDDLYYTVTDAGNFSRKVTAAELKSYLNLTNGVPSVVGQNGKYLTNDGINYFWQDANIPVDHSDLTNHGANTHDQIDTAITNSVAHIADTTIHMPSFAIGDYEKALSVDAGGFKWKEFVDLVTSQIVGGLKFFNLLPQQTVYSAPTIDEELTPKKYVDDQLDAKLPDQTGQTNKFLQTDGTSLTGNLRWTEALDLTTSQQVGPLAVKTFVEHPQQLVYIAPTSNTQYTPKQYVDGLIASSIASISGVLPSVTGHFGEFLTNDGINSYWTNLSVLGVLPPQGGHAGEYLTTNGTTASWVAVSGEANTASNLGTGTGIFKQKTGVDLELYSIKGGTNVSVGLVGNEIVIDSTDTGEANTASNVGTGEGVFKQKTGVDLEFKTIKAGSNITLNSSANEIEIVGTGGGNPLINIGTGSQIWKGLNLGNNEIRTLTTPNTEITLTTNANDIEIKNEHIVNINNLNVGSNIGGIKNLNSLTTATYNIAIGQGSVLSSLTSIGSSIGIGFSAGKTYAPTNGTYSGIFIGNNAGANIGNSGKVIAIGRNSLSNMVGISNLAIGDLSLGQGLSGNNNLSIGHLAGSTLVGDNNLLVGYGSGISINGNSNSMLGHFTGASLTTGINNTSVGYYSGGAITTGSNNTSLGYQSLRNTNAIETTALGAESIGFGTVGSTGSRNSAVGYRSMYLNTTGSDNVAFGHSAGYNNTTGNYNVSIGNNSLTLNTTGVNNVSIGHNSLSSHTLSDNNTSIGYNSCKSLITADRNVVIGTKAMELAVTATTSVAIGNECMSQGNNLIGNVGIGNEALKLTTAGANTAIGRSSLLFSTTGQENVAVGYLAGANLAINPAQSVFVGSGSGATGSYTNSTAVGYNAIVTASNYVRIGNTAVTQIGGQVAWSNLSDVRIKKNIKDITKGLDFIKSLRPVEYNISNNDTDIKEHWGLIAQELQEKIGDSKGVLDVPENPDNMMSIAYTELVAPLIKAIQEQQEQIESLKQEIQSIKNATN